MIISDLTHVNDQLRLTPHFEKGLAFLHRTDLATMADGRAPIDGDNVYAEVQSYVTKPASEAKYDAHRRYIDIQFVVTGEETIGWAPIEDLQVSTPYVDQHDYLLGSVEESRTIPARLRAGQFAILFPADAHAPRLATTSPVAVRKIVVKVRVA